MQAKLISNKNKHTFFGYYDVPCWDRSGRYHLCHQVEFIDRIPDEKDVATIAMIDTHNNNRIIELSKTTAWNFQQGAFLQWHPTENDSKIIYNIRNDDGYGAEILDVFTGEKRQLDRPVATVASNGKYAISVSFQRIFDFRPGYGYAGYRDANFDVKAPKDDGIFLVDLESGKSELVLSLYDINEFLKEKGSLVADNKILINHINFNTDGSRFVALVRSFAKGENEWRTATVTGDYNGKNLYLLSDEKLASHYFWKDRDNLLIWATHKKDTTLYLLHDLSEDYVKFTDECFKPDGHCSYTTDRRFILYDSYPDAECYRHLFIYDAAMGDIVERWKFKTIIPPVLDIRCDLHPRFKPGTSNLTFDSTHEGFRGIYYIGE